MLQYKFFFTTLISLFIFNACNDYEKEKTLLNSSTKDFFTVKDNSTYLYVDAEDTSKTNQYTVKNFFNKFSNPDYTNNEIMYYEIMPEDNSPSFIMRIEAGSILYSDRITLMTIKNDSTFFGPLFINTAGEFEVYQSLNDSLFLYSTYQFGNTTYENVLRLKIFENSLYKEVFFAKSMGMIARIEKNGKLYYSKKTNIIN
jgi:hypothetical protein